MWSPKGCCSWSGKHSGCCCCPMPVYREQLRAVPNRTWFHQCMSETCAKCKKRFGNYLNKQNLTGDDDNDDSKLNCACVCRRNRHIIEALSCLFKCTVQFMVSMLFKLAYQQHQPLKHFPRDRVWNVMEHVKAPYTELNDLEIYDSMYDRCGLPIDPLDTDNNMKILRMIFLQPVLTMDQYNYLIHMLNQLNDHANCPVRVDLLLQTLECIELKKLVCSLRQQEELTRRLYTGRKCSAICQLYQKVATVDKQKVTQIRRQKRRKKYKTTINDKPQHVEEVDTNRKSALNRQFCVRKGSDPNSATSSPRNTRLTSMRRNRYSGFSNSY